MRHSKQGGVGLPSRITSCCAHGLLLEDRAINEYADSIWNVEPLDVEE